MDDFTIFEVANGRDSTIEQSGPNSKPKVKTVPLYRPSKRCSEPRAASTDSCHIAIEEMTGPKGKFF